MEDNTEEEVKVVAAAWGNESTILHQDDLKERMIKIASVWRNGCS